ncbi:metalloprotease, partial [Coemansia sp. Benny D160-2]
MFEQSQTTESRLPYYEYTGPMEQSPNDHHQHRLIRLPNGMTVLCTHDLQAESAAASLTVNVGKTLKAAALQTNVSLADEVRKFYDMYYSARIMKLAVVGNHTLDQLTEWAVSKFSAVKDKGDTSLKLDSHPLGPNELGKVIFYETLEDSNGITLVFPVPNAESKYRQLVD